MWETCFLIGAWLWPAYYLGLLAGQATGSVTALRRMSEWMHSGKRPALRTPLLRQQIEGLTLNHDVLPTHRKNGIELHGRSGR